MIKDCIEHYSCGDGAAEETDAAGSTEEQWIEKVRSRGVKEMVERLMNDYHATFQWAMRTVLGSQTYNRMLKNAAFRGESPLYIYEHLKRELEKQKVLDIVPPSAL